ncbi:MAG: S9 family peptidase [Phycisphaerales bacterium]|nr:S9 family peptidase [Phycisphaerales bacterium]
MKYATRFYGSAARRCSARLVFAAGILLFAGPAAPAQDHALTAIDVARLRSVSSVQISPQSNTSAAAAYTLSVPRRAFADDDGPPWSELHILTPGGESRPFITGHVNVNDIKWTPDGQSISFRAKRGEDKETSLYVIDVLGGEARKILQHDTGIGAYAWSPDGKQVAFLATEKEPKDKKERQDKGFKAEVYEEGLRSVKVWLAAPQPARDSFSDDEPPKPKALDLPGSATDVQFSPTGQHLAVALAPSPLIDDEYMRQKLHVVEVASGKVVSTLDTVGKLGTFRWSPDGRRIAFIGAADLHDPAEGRLMIGGVEGGAVRDVLPNYPGHITSIAWQDDDTVMYLVDEGLWTAFGKVDADGANQKTILPAGTHVMSGLSLAANGLSGAMICESAEHPPEAYTMVHGDAAPRRITTSNPWLADRRLAKQEPVRYTARDGLEIEGVLVRPLDEEPGKRYPLILSVHGGPEAHESMGWKTHYARPGQLAAAKGFAVFYPNYRGSTGRGVAFSKLDQGDYAGKEFDDLVDAADHLASTGLVDRAKVGVTGGSYGGFATAWCATALSEHFAAGVMFVGLSDLVSKFGTTDIPQEMTLVHATKYPWEDWEFFRQRSPITHFQNCRTPLLIMAGADDTRVDPSQSMELYRYLKTWGKTPVRLVFYPGEGHGNRKAAARLDYNLRMMQWFEHYLKGPGGDPPAQELDYTGLKPKKSEPDDSERAEG